MFNAMLQKFGLLRVGAKKRQAGRRSGADMMDEDVMDIPVFDRKVENSEKQG